MNKNTEMLNAITIKTHNTSGANDFFSLLKSLFGPKIDSTSSAVRAAPNHGTARHRSYTYLYDDLMS